MLSLRKAASFLRKALFLVCGWAGVVGMGAFMLMVLLIVVDVVLRRFFNSPLAFSFELIEIILSVVAFCSIAYTTSVGRHVSIAVLISRFKPNVQKKFVVVTDSLSVFLFGLIGWQTIVQGIHIRDIGQVSGLLGIPYYPFLLVVGFGAILAGLALLARLINFMTGEAKK